MDYLFWIEICLFLVLLGLSAFFSSSETSLFSLNQAQLEQMRQDGNRRLSLIESMLAQPRRLIVTILIGNEFVNIAASVISAAVIYHLMGPESTYINLFVMVPILLLFGEITPKALAMRHNVAFATFQSRPIDQFARLIRPVRLVVRKFSDWLTTVIVGRERLPGTTLTEDVVRTLAHEAVGEGELERSEARYIDQILDFGNSTLDAIKTPRSQLFMMSSDLTIGEVIADLKLTRHTKVPVFSAPDRDHIVGVLHVRDLLGIDLAELEDRRDWLLSIVHKPYYVPESKRTVALFHAFRKKKLSIALTVDEYGGVTGLVSMEDLLECIFGDIKSPSDAVKEAVLEVLPDGRARIEPSMPIDHFNRVFSTDLPSDEAETVGGLLLHAHGELPTEGTTLSINDWDFTIQTVVRSHIEEVLVEHQAPDFQSADYAAVSDGDDQDNPEEDDE